MSLYGLYGKLVAQPGRREELVTLLLDGADELGDLPGCLQYLINLAEAEPNAIWVTEIWESEAAHDASLELDAVRAIIARARPLIAPGGEQIRLTPVGGKGMPS